MTNKERFKANIRMFEFEPHSYCNRKCWFCPNNFIDRTGPVKFFDEKIYAQVLEDLRSIDYSECIGFAGWCEPFSEATATIRMFRDARDKLPNAMLFSNTNTDYLTTEIVKEAADAGLDHLKCQLYFGKDEEYTKDAILQKMMFLKAKLPGIEFNERAEGIWFALVGNMVVIAYSKDFHKVGKNRCDVNVRKPVVRTATCYETLTMFGINYNGWAVPCCNMRSDYPPHKELLLGKMDDKPGRIFEMYQGVLIPETQYPCSTCMGLQGHANMKMVHHIVLKELKNG